MRSTFQFTKKYYLLKEEEKMMMLNIYNDELMHSAGQWIAADIPRDVHDENTLTSHMQHHNRKRRSRCSPMKKKRRGTSTYTATQTSSHINKFYLHTLDGAVCAKERDQTGRNFLHLFIIELLYFYTYCFQYLAIRNKMYTTVHWSLLRLYI